MILQSLDRYYYRLLSEEDGSGKPKVPCYGYSDEYISCILVLNASGQIIDYIPHLTSDKNPQPKRMFVPQSFKRTSGLRPFFLWDKTDYVLGIDKDRKIKDKNFKIFRDSHLSLLKNEKNIGLQALCKFLQNWQPKDFSSLPFDITELLGGNVVFKLDGQKGMLHEQSDMQTLWDNCLKERYADEWFGFQSDASVKPTKITKKNKYKDSVKEYGICLVSGEEHPIARTHLLPIKGVQGGQSSGCSIVSFNNNAFTSFNKEQGANSPISEYSSFNYTTTLNYLLRRENNHSFTIGDASTVFWAEAPDDSSAEAEEAFFFDMMTVTDGEENQKVFDILQQIAKGRPLKEIVPNLHADTRFYILGLAPNASRISIRFWLNTTFGQLAQNLSDHWQDLAIDPCPWQTPPSIWRLLIQTAPLGKTENISPVLAGEMTRAVINGTLYPMSLLSQLLARIRTDGDANGLRIAMIKAILARKFRKGLIKEGVPMSLDKESTNRAYLLGRMFAVLERIQYQALGDINASIADRYYGSASAVPFSVFPHLLVGARHHLSRLRKDKPGLAVNLDKDLGEIIAALPEHYPRHFSIDEQGRFSIGYYQQKQSYFASKESVTPTEA
jgi:CRISPR-associated protein, csd1 family